MGSPGPTEAGPVLLRDLRASKTPCVCKSLRCFRPLLPCEELAFPGGPQGGGGGAVSEPPGELPKNVFASSPPRSKPLQVEEWRD